MHVRNLVVFLLLYHLCFEWRAISYYSAKDVSFSSLNGKNRPTKQYMKQETRFQQSNPKNRIAMKNAHNQFDLYTLYTLYQRTAANHSISEKDRFLFFSPDIHSGTKIDLVTSLMSLNQSILLSSDSGGLPKYYSRSIPSSPLYNETNPHPQLIIPKYPFIKRGESPNINKESVLTRFYDRVIQHPAFASIDCIVCMFYPGQCQVYVPFNKTVLFLPAHRFLLQRCMKHEVFALMKAMFSFPEHVLVRAASVYDAEYIQYFTGISVPVIYATSLFAYPEPTTYRPIYDEFLLAPFKFKEISFATNITHACTHQGMNCSLTTVLQRFGPRWKFEELYHFKAIIAFPYAVLSYYLNDILASCTPLFVPSPSFLLQLNILKDVRNADEVYCGRRFRPPPPSPQSRHPYSPEDSSPEATLYWLQFASFYTPSSIQFDSWEDLAVKLRTTNYSKVFDQRREENRKIKQHNHKEWIHVMERIEKNRGIPPSYESAKLYHNVTSFF